MIRLSTLLTIAIINFCITDMSVVDARLTSHRIELNEEKKKDVPNRKLFLEDFHYRESHKNLLYPLHKSMKGSYSYPPRPKGSLSYPIKHPKLPKTKKAAKSSHSRLLENRYAWWSNAVDVLCSEWERTTRIVYKCIKQIMWNRK